MKSSCPTIATDYSTSFHSEQNNLIFLMIPFLDDNHQGELRFPNGDSQIPSVTGDDTSRRSRSRNLSLLAVLDEALLITEQVTTSDLLFDAYVKELKDKSDGAKQ